MCVEERSEVLCEKMAENRYKKEEQREYSEALKRSTGGVSDIDSKLFSLYDTRS
jgi:hypothetical protein